MNYFRRPRTVLNHPRRDFALRLVAAALAIIGMIIMLRSQTVALDQLHEYTRSLGGSIDSETYHLLLDSSIATYRLLGAILTAVGLYRALR